jgi:hypothetical protein
VAGPGRAGWVQPSPCGLSWTQPQKKRNKKNKKIEKQKNKKVEKIKNVYA